MHRLFILVMGSVLVVSALATACGGGSSSGSTTSSAHRGGTFTILSSSSFGAADPAQNYSWNDWQLLLNTHDALVQFQRVGGEGPQKLLPDLATSVPKPTDGGKTYAFHIRRGVKFSDGQILKPSDFVHTFERQFTVPGPTDFYSGIVGASACKASHCDLSNGAVADDQNYTLTIHLTAPDPEFLYKLTLPFAFVVPANTPSKNLGNEVPPGTGPYMWKSYNPNKEAVLVRNPYFHVWNAKVQPPGNPDSIVEKFGLQVSDAVTAVENGQADMIFEGDTIPADRLNEIATKYASQVHVNPLTATWYFALNTKRPPFNNLKARQAINYAFDREAAVKLVGGPSLAAPTCQILPPNFPGYVQYCPYTKDPAPNGAGPWTGPDIEKAQQLVRESGTAGAKVVVITDGADKPIGEQMVSDLNKIGYQASLKPLSGAIEGSFIANSNNLDKWQVGWQYWYADYPAASDFLNVLLGCGSILLNSDANTNYGFFCDKSIQGQMDEAAQLGVTDPDAANQIWAEVDHEVTDQAPWVAMYNPKQIDFLSSRWAGYVFKPQWEIQISQLYLK